MRITILPLLAALLVLPPALADDPAPGPPAPPRGDQEAPGPPVEAPPKGAKKGPAKPPAKEAGVVVADPKHRKPWAWDAESPELLYKDRSWTHIGDNNFSASSDGADDLTRKSGGVILELRVPLTDAMMAEVAKARWKTVVLKGSCIGNDTGKFGSTTATLVHLGGTKIGEITRSGGIAIRFDKALLARVRAARKDGQVAFRITTGGQTASTDRDDQELGRFKLLLSEKPMPPKQPKPEKTAPPAPPGK